MKSKKGFNPSTVTQNYVKELAIMSETKYHEYLKKMYEQDPNSLLADDAMYALECRTVNDYVSWESLHGEVVTYKLETLEEE